MTEGGGRLVGVVATCVLTLMSASGCSGSSKKPADAATSSTPTTRGARTFALGATRMTFVDDSRPTAANGGAPAAPARTLETAILYPAAGPAGTPPAKDAPAATSDGPFPLVVFAHGFGSPGTEYETLLERWAAAGYVVAAPRFPLTASTTPGGPNAADYVNQPGDVRFVITSVLAASAKPDGVLSHLVDPGAVGIAGHSMGGITTLGLAANTCCQDPRVKAAVVMSGDALTFPHGSFDYAKAPPLLFVHGDADPVVSYESSIDAFNAARGPKGLLTIIRGDHGAPVDPAGKAFANVVVATTTFFDRYLKHAAVTVTDTGLGTTKGATRLVFDATAGSETTVPTTPTTVGLTRHATASATTGLTNGQSITITWSNYTPGKSVNVVECSSRDTLDAAACDLKHAVLLHPDPTGSGSVDFTIVTGTVGNGVCDAAHDTCSLIVNDGGSFDPAASVRIPITFARS